MLNRLRSIFEKRSSVATPSPELLALFGSRPTASGVAVNDRTFAESSTAYAAVRVISEAMGNLPFHLYRRGPDGQRERDRAHPAAKLLSGDFNPWTGSGEARTALQWDALAHRGGTGYALVSRLGGAPAEIHRLDPSCVTLDLDDVEPRYRVRMRGVERYHSWRDMLTIATPGSAPGRPVSIVHDAREAIGVDIVMGRHQSRLFGRGAKPSGVLKHPSKISPEAAMRLKAQFEQDHAGDASGRTLLLEEGLEFTQTSLNSTDAQFLELRRFAAQDVARAFKVPATLVGDFERAVWSNVIELNRQFVQQCLLPWAEAWQAALSRVLLTPAERETHFIEAVFDDLLRADWAARFSSYAQAVGGPWMTPNEARALENRPPIEGGDELLRQAGQTGAGVKPDDAPAEPHDDEDADDDA